MLVKRLLLGLPLLFLTCGAQNDKFEFKVCDPSVNYLATVHSIDIQPFPVVKTKDVTVTVNATLLCDIEQGSYVDGKVKLAFIEFPIEKEEICDDYLHCPIQQGDVYQNVTQTVPSYLPPGTFNVEFRGYTDKEESLFCIRADVKVINPV